MPRRTWTISDEEFVRSMAPHYTYREIAEAMGRTYTSVKSKAKVLGIISGRRHVYTESDDAYIRIHYPSEGTAAIADKIGVTISALHGRAGTLGVKKTKEYLAQFGLQVSQHPSCIKYSPGHVPYNKGKKMSPEVREKVRHTWYQKGNKPHNTLHDGAVSIRGDKSSGRSYKWIRIDEGHWELLHRVNYVLSFGPIPEGYIVSMKDDDSLNCDPNNLELITREENMSRNTITRYPSEVQSTIHLLSKVKKILKNEK